MQKENWFDGMTDDEMVEEIKRQNALSRAELLSEAKKEAKTSAKEPFDMKKAFEYYYFPRNPQNELEYEYYVARSSCMTLKEFAQKTQEYDQYDGVF
jgi:hypothetical protein